MKKKTQGILLIIPLSLVTILALSIVMFLMVVNDPDFMLGFFIFSIIILAFVKGIQLLTETDLK